MKDYRLLKVPDSALIKELRYEIGVLKSENDELKYKLESLMVNKDINKKALIESRKDELYKHQLKLNNKLQKEVRKLRKDNEKLIMKNLQQTK